MTFKVNPEFINDIKEYGEVNIEDCFNCGNCTAICSLSTENDNFPRRMIRYAQLGLEEPLLSSKELWMCYYCGECTETCPRQANPGEYMAAARRYAIGKYDRLGLAKLLFTSPVFNILFLVILAIVFGLFLSSYQGTMPSDTLDLFAFIPGPLIHNLGIIAGVIIALLALSGVITMVLDVRKTLDFPKGTRLNWWGALWDTGWKEVLTQKRYRQDCEENEEEQDTAWYLQKWFLHGSVMWGFMGLFIVTATNYFFEIIGVRETGDFMPVWHPVRLSGIIAGLLLVYGTTALIIKRLQKDDEAFAYSTPSDWSFLILMWLSGITGFALDVAIYLPTPHDWGYWMLLVHLIAVGELLLLAPFTKFAHAVYRSIALYIFTLEPLPQEAE